VGALAAVAYRRADFEKECLSGLFGGASVSCRVPGSSSRAGPERRPFDRAGCLTDCRRPIVRVIVQTIVQPIVRVIVQPIVFVAVLPAPQSIARFHDRFRETLTIGRV
jgi:hypothetical protein